MDQAWLVIVDALDKNSETNRFWYSIDLAANCPTGYQCHASVERRVSVRRVLESTEHAGPSTA